MKKNCKKTIKSTPKKKMGIFSPVFFFIHPHPINIGPARQQPRDWGSLLFSLSLVGEGAQLLLISFAATRRRGICNGSVEGMEDEGGHTL